MTPVYINVSIVSLRLQSPGYQLPVRGVHAILMANIYLSQEILCTDIIITICNKCKKSLVRFQRNFRRVIFQLILVIDGWSICCKIVLKWMQMDHIDGKSTLVPVMAWCHQATSHYLSQLWPDLCRHMASLGHNELNSWTTSSFFLQISLHVTSWVTIC